MKKIILILLFLYTIIYANVSATVDKNVVVKGDEVTLTLSADGDRVKFPSISDIEGYPVESTGRSQNITIINGKTTKTISESYTFIPLKSITIPSFEIKVDGKTEKTKPINIKVVSSSQSRGSLDFDLKLIANKKEAYVGEPITLKVVFRQKVGVKVDDIQFYNPEFKHFWTKSDGKDRKEIVGDYIVHNITYILIPQQPGDFKIPPVKVAIAKRVMQRDIFSFMLQNIKWKNIYSNELEIKVKPLPAGVSIYGKYSISALVDKTQTQSNKPVNLTLIIKGEGNIDDIDSFDLQIPGVTVYKNKPKRDTYLENGTYKGTFTQKFALVADSSYEIPAIKFKYFDEDSKSVKTIETKPIKIVVQGAPKKIAPHILQTQKETQTELKIPKEKIVYKEKNLYEKWIYLLVGFVLGFLLSNIKKINFKNNKKNIQHPLSYEIKKAKDDKELLKILLPYSSKNKKIKKIVEKLEENIYLGKSHKINKKILSKEIEEILHPKNDDFEDL